MISTALALGWLLCIFVLGWLIAHAVGVHNKIEKAGLSFLLGAWLITLEMMVAYQVAGFFSPQLSTATAFASAVVIIVAMGKSKRNLLWEELLSLRTWRFKKQRAIKSWWRQCSKWEKALFLLLAIFLGYTFWSNWTWPVSDWDAIALYDFRALLIKLVGHWQEGRELGYFYHYPPFTSLLHGSLYQLGFERVKIVYSLFATSFLLVLYAFLLKRTNRLQALLGCLLTVTTPLLWGHLTIAYTNLTYTIYFSLAILHAWEWLENKAVTSMILAFLMIAVSVWTRQSEPFWLVVVGLIAFGNFLIKKWNMWAIFGSMLVVFLGLLNYWRVYTHSLNLPPPPISVDDAIYSVPITLGTVVHHGFLVTDHFITNVMSPIALTLIAFFVVVGFDDVLMKKRSSRIALNTIVILFTLVFMGTYYFSFTYKSWNLIGESLTRLVMFLIPLLVFIIAQSSFWCLLFRRKKP